MKVHTLRQSRASGVRRTPRRRCVYPRWACPSWRTRSSQQYRVCPRSLQGGQSIPTSGDHRREEVLTDTEEPAKDARTEDVLTSGAVEGSALLLRLSSLALTTGSLAVLFCGVTLSAEQGECTGCRGRDSAGVATKMGLRVERVCCSRDDANVDWKQVRRRSHDTVEMHVPRPMSPPATAGWSMYCFARFQR